MYRPCKSHRFLRLISCALACLGLLGHGLTMLLASLLLSPAGSAGAGFPERIEICSAGGIVTPQQGGETGQGTPEDSPDQPGPPHSGGIKGCPICNAFAQNGAADLPPSAAILLQQPPSAVPLPIEADSAGSHLALHALSRGPPAFA